jgi:hypothetical protein
MCRNREILPLAVKPPGEFETLARNTNQVSIKPFTMVREAKKSFTRSFDNQPSVQYAGS